MLHNVQTIPKLLVQKRDIELFNFLFESKGATFRQIQKHVFKMESDNYPHRRLQKLRGAGLIRKTYDDLGRNEFIYTLTPNSCNRYISPDKELSKAQLKTDCEKHDINLIDIREQFEKLHVTEKFYTENMLLSGMYDFEFGDAIDNLKRLRPDAIAKLSDCDSRSLVAIELELTGKSKSEYRNWLLNYRDSRHVNYVFVICKSKSLRNRLMHYQKENEILQNDKFYYTTLNDLLQAKNSIVFEQVSGKKYEYSF